MEELEKVIKCKDVSLEMKTKIMLFYFQSPRIGVEAGQQRKVTGKKNVVLEESSVGTLDC